MTPDMAASAVSLGLSSASAAFSVLCAVRCSRARRSLTAAVRARRNAGQPAYRTGTASAEDIEQERGTEAARDAVDSGHASWGPLRLQADAEDLHPW